MYFLLMGTFFDMRFSIGQKIGISVVTVTLLAILCAAISTINMWSIHRHVHMTTTESFPLAIAAGEMYSCKARARLELLRYLSEERTPKLEDIEKKYQAHLMEHDQLEDAIGKAALHMEQKHNQMRKMWEEAMATIMPAFERHATEIMEDHRKYLAVKSARIEKMEKHEEFGMKILSLLSDMQKNNKAKDAVVGIAADLKTELMHAMFSDEEYVTKGALVSNEELKKIGQDFAGHTTEFEKSLLSLGKLVKKKYEYGCYKGDKARFRRVFFFGTWQGAVV